MDQGNPSTRDSERDLLQRTINVLRTDLSELESPVSAPSPSSASAQSSSTANASDDFRKLKYLQSVSVFFSLHHPRHICIYSCPYGISYFTVSHYFNSFFFASPLTTQNIVTVPNEFLASTSISILSKSFYCSLAAIRRYCARFCRIIWRNDSSTTFPIINFERRKNASDERMLKMEMAH